MKLKYTNTFPTRLGEIVRIRDLEVGEIGEYTDRSGYNYESSKGIQWRIAKSGSVHKRRNSQYAWGVSAVASYLVDPLVFTTKVEIVEVL